MSEIELDGDGGPIGPDQRRALDELHGWMTREIAEAHRAGDRAQAEKLTAERGAVSGGLSREPGAGVVPAPLDHDQRETLEDRRAALTRELHAAVAQKDSGLAGRLDRERNELTEGLYGNGDVVGTGGRSL